MNVLIVEDEKSLAKEMSTFLKNEGYVCEVASTGKEASEKIFVNPYDFLLLDLGLPDYEGLDLLKEAKEANQEAAVIILTARGSTDDKVKGLDLGADDYLAKPFDFDELVARIRAILRRARRGKSDEDQVNEQVLTFGDLILNDATHEVTRAGRQIDLTSTEYNLLHLFMSHPRQVLDRQTILNRVWGYDFMGETNIIEVYVRYLREKIEDEPSTPRLIQTVRGSGYILKG